MRSTSEPYVIATWSLRVVTALVVSSSQVDPSSVRQTSARTLFDESMPPERSNRSSKMTTAAPWRATQPGLEVTCVHVAPSDELYTSEFGSKRSHPAMTKMELPSTAAESFVRAAQEAEEVTCVHVSPSVELQTSLVDPSASEPPMMYMASLKTTVANPLRPVHCAAAVTWVKVVKSLEEAE
jgi:hypothetical protein